MLPLVVVRLYRGFFQRTLKNTTDMATEINKLFASLEDDRFYSVYDLVDMTGQNRQTIMNYINNGHIPATRYDANTYVTGRNFKRYLMGEPRT